MKIEKHLGGWSKGNQPIKADCDTFTFNQSFILRMNRVCVRVCVINEARVFYDCIFYFLNVA